MELFIVTENSEAETHMGRAASNGHPTLGAGAWIKTPVCEAALITAAHMMTDQELRDDTVMLSGQAV